MAFVIDRQGYDAVRLLCFFLTLLWVSIGNVTGRQVEFLKEILIGRCYYDPPTGIAGACPSVVDYIIGGLEGNLDKDITASTFDSYFSGAFFNPGASGSEGLFWLKGNQPPTTNFPLGWTTPETTPGGAMMEGLNFCGIDLRQDCPRISGASTVFWTSAYSAYAKLVRREVHIVLEEGAFLKPLLEGAIPSLSSDAVTSINLYSPDCHSADVQTVAKALTEVMDDTRQRRNAIPIVCQENVEALTLCHDPTSVACLCLATSTDTSMKVSSQETPILETNTSNMITENNDKGTTKDKKDDKAHAIVFLLALVLVLLAFFVGYKRQKMTGYRSIPVHIQSSNIPVYAQQ